MTETTTFTTYAAPGTSELAKALAKAQSEFPTIERSKTVSVTTKTGGRYTFDYAPLDAITKAISKPLADNDLAYSQILTHIGDRPALRTVLLHSSGEKLEGTCPLPLNGGASPQEIGSLITYMRRYALVALLGIATEEDDDGNTASGNVASSAAGQGTDGTSSSSPAAEAMRRAEEAYQAAAKQAMSEGVRPADVPVHFGKNKGTPLGALTPQQLRWYANEWQLQDTPSEYDHRLKVAAVALAAGNNEPLEAPPDPDIPFA